MPKNVKYVKKYRGNVPLFYKEGIVLVDYRHQKYICGDLTNKEKPLTLKLLKKDLNWKLVIYPELYFRRVTT